MKNVSKLYVFKTLSLNDIFHSNNTPKIFISFKTQLYKQTQLIYIYIYTTIIIFHKLVLNWCITSKWYNKCVYTKDCGKNYKILTQVFTQFSICSKICGV